MREHNKVSSFRKSCTINPKDHALRTMIAKKVTYAIFFTTLGLAIQAAVLKVKYVNATVYMTNILRKRRIFKQEGPEALNRSPE